MIEIRTFTRDQLIAYDAFLWSEEVRHLQDVEDIKKKRKVLHDAGFRAGEIGPWITEEEIRKSGDPAGGHSDTMRNVKRLGFCEQNQNSDLFRW